MCVRACGSTVRESGYNRIVYLGHELLKERKRKRDGGREEEREREGGREEARRRGSVRGISLNVRRAQCERVY